MTYDELTTQAKAYADRYDTEVVTNMTAFFAFAEARINRSIKVREMVSRAKMRLNEGQEYYPLPADFAGIRDIELAPTDGKRKTLHYVSPEQANIVAESQTAFTGYTIIANQLHIVPAQGNSVVEIVYYQKLMPLGAENESNWLSETYPDAYLSAVLAEIELFVKNGDAANIWHVRFNDTMADIDTNDMKERWSGTPLQVRVM